ncbi:MAG: AAA family ATPase [Candidatus Riflebacteria bacterium]|nr:AAA family ATPase [Candidatus Riflebacteria bacterium]
MSNKKPLPIGYDIFENVIRNNCYYVDKTSLVEYLKEKGGKVNLFTRPRRFGKTLNMTMMYEFFRIGGNPELFNGLKISKNKALCEEWQNKFPTIFMTLKGVEGNNFESARLHLMGLIEDAIWSFKDLKNSEKLDEKEKEKYNQLLSIREANKELQNDIICQSLRILSELIYKHYGKNTVFIIDEYDVPLDKAENNGYFNEMISLIRGMFNNAFKTNPYLEMTILTGCLRISKESIFTGMNNFQVFSVADELANDNFGFTEEEVKEMFDYYDVSARLDDAKKWYDGYRIGNKDVYCPWDIILFCSDLREKIDIFPRAYWANTSGNSIVRKMLENADDSIKQELEELVAGGVISKKIKQELTYQDLYKTNENIWSVLFCTGYLTSVGRTSSTDFQLRIPNREIRILYEQQIMEWLKESFREKQPLLNNLYDGLYEGDAEKVEKALTEILAQSISVRDSMARKDYKENFYQGLLIGLLTPNNKGLVVESNRESGDGYPDLILYTRNYSIGIIIELKYAESPKKFQEALDEGMKQIENNRYIKIFDDEDAYVVRKFVIACYKKRCRVAIK